MGARRPLTVTAVLTARGGGILPHKDLMGTCGQSLTRYLYLDDKQQNFYKLLLINIDLVSGLNVLNRVSKIGILS